MDAQNLTSVEWLGVKLNELMCINQTIPIYDASKSIENSQKGSEVAYAPRMGRFAHVQYEGLGGGERAGVSALREGA